MIGNYIYNVYNVLTLLQRCSYRSDVNVVNYCISGRAETGVRMSLCVCVCVGGGGVVAVVCVCASIVRYAITVI